MGFDVSCDMFVQWPGEFLPEWKQTIYKYWIFLEFVMYYALFLSIDLLWMDEYVNISLDAENKKIHFHIEIRNVFAKACVNNSSGFLSIEKRNDALKYCTWPCVRVIHNIK